MVNGRGPFANGCLHLCRLGPPLIAHFDQFRTRDSHTPVILGSEWPLDNDLVPHPRHIRQPFHLRRIRTRHASGGPQCQCSTASRCHVGGFSTQELGDYAAGPVQQLLHVHVVPVRSLHGLGDLW